MNFCPSREIYPTNMGKKLLDSTSKRGLDAAITASKKFVHKRAEVTGELIGKGIAEKIVKPKPVLEEN